MQALLALSTAPDADTAERLAQALVERGLAACVSVLPGLRSTYRWQGRVESADEQLLLIKTVPARFAELQSALVALHPYEVPELVAVEVKDGLPAYLAWLAESCARPTPPG
jgi:periplasmic divalent cation tolerance protein